MRPRTGLNAFFIFLLLAGFSAGGAADSFALDVLFRTETVDRGGAGLVEIGGASAPSGVNAFFNGRPLLLLPYGPRLLGLIGVDLDSAPGFHPLTVSWSSEDLRRTKNLLLRVDDRDYGVRNLNLRKDTLQLSQAEAERASFEQTEVLAVLETFTREILWTPPFVRPGEGKVTSVYGRKTLVNGRPRPSPHLGVDFRAAVGAPVRAPAAGSVALAVEHFLPGKSLYIDHGQGLFSVFYHLSEFEVEAGQMVEQGMIVARAGNTGASTTGPHIHYGLYLGGVWIDPLAFQDVTELICLGLAPLE